MPHDPRLAVDIPGDEVERTGHSQDETIGGEVDAHGTATTWSADTQGTSSEASQAAAAAESSELSSEGSRAEGIKAEEVEIDRADVVWSGSVHCGWVMSRASPNFVLLVATSLDPRCRARH